MSSQKVLSGTETYTLYNDGCTRSLAWSILFSPGCYACIFVHSRVLMAAYAIFPANVHCLRANSELLWNLWACPFPVQVVVRYIPVCRQWVYIYSCICVLLLFLITLFSRHCLWNGLPVNWSYAIGHQYMWMLWDGTSQSALFTLCSLFQPIAAITTY